MESDSSDGDYTNDSLKLEANKPKKALKTRLKKLFANKLYIRILPELVLWVIAGYIPSVFLSAWGAEYFAGCSARSANDENEHCKFDYNTYNEWGSLFSSIGGVLAFLFGPMIGRLSDAYGRKAIFYINILLSSLLYIPMIFYPNIWVHFAMRIPAGLNSSDNSFTPMMVAYISDIFPENERTLAYSVGYTFCAIGLIFGVAIAILFGYLFGDQSNFIAIGVLDVIQLLYVYLLVPESLISQNRKSFSFANLNPFRPLYQCCCYHPIVLWTGLVLFCISLPETGILDMALIYVLDQMDVENETDANITNAIFIVCCAIGLVNGTLLILPKLQSLDFENIEILCIGVCLFAVSFVMLSLVAYIKSIVLVIISAILLTSGFIAFPAANGIVSKYLTKSEQGIGFGIIFSVRSLTWIIAPYSFALSYNTFKKMGYPALTFLIGVVMVLFSLIIILFPLKQAIAKTNKHGRKYSLSTIALQDIDHSSAENLLCIDD